MNPSLVGAILNVLVGSRTMRVLLGVVAAVTEVVGCGGTTTTGVSRQGHDAGSDKSKDSETSSTRLDAGTFACGPTRCSANDICVYPPCGCIVETAPRTDAGACPAGFKPYDDAGTCFLPPGCPSYPPYCTAPDGGSSYMCSGQHGTLSGFITGPLPIGSSRICYDTCV